MPIAEFASSVVLPARRARALWTSPAVRGVATIRRAVCLALAGAVWAAGLAIAADDAKAPDSTKAPDSVKAPDTKAPDTKAPDTKAPDSANAPDTKPSDTSKAPDTKPSDTAKPPEKTKASEKLISLDPPGPREFVRDQAHLITEKDQAEIKKIADRLLTQKATPIIVVTMNSMSDYVKYNMRIEAFAQFLFDQWNIGAGKIHGQDWNTGILLLVSKGDRKARIELGANWKHDHDRQTDQIMEQIIIPHFKKGDYSGGILAGVKALDQMARGLTLPAGAPGRPGAGLAGKSLSEPSPLMIIIMAAMAGVAIFTIVSLVRSGAHGWGWLLWAGVFALLGMVIYTLMTNSGGGGGGGDYSGGSFGGGSSGGGGSTGSW